MIKPEKVNPLTADEAKEATRIEADIDARLEQQRGRTFYCGGERSDHRVLRVVARRYEAADWVVRFTRNQDGHLHLHVLHPQMALTRR